MARFCLLSCDRHSHFIYIFSLSYFLLRLPLFTLSQPINKNERKNSDCLARELLINLQDSFSMLHQYGIYTALSCICRSICTVVNTIRLRLKYSVILLLHSLLVVKFIHQFEHARRTCRKYRNF